uniref:Transmembrane protein 154 n=1 Tax=Capra hircus TaxID=9925 RepID=A0A8C2PLA5_CAPHI
MPGRAPPEAPRAALFLAAVLASLPTRPAQGEEDTELSGDVPPGTEGLDEESEALSTLASVTTEPYITSINSTLVDEDTDQLEFILMVLIPVILLSLLLLSAILLVIYHKRKRNKQEPSSQGSQSVLQTRKIKLSYWVRPACCLESSQRNVLWQVREDVLCLGIGYSLMYSSTPRNVLKFDSWGAFGQQFCKEYFTCRGTTPFSLALPVRVQGKGRLWSDSMYNGPSPQTRSPQTRRH